MDLFYISLLTVIVSYIWIVVIPYLWNGYKKRWALMKDFPSMEKNHWLFGDLHHFPGLNEDGLMYFLKYVKLYPRYSLFSLGPFMNVVELNHPETIKELTKTSEPKQRSSGGGYDVLLPWIGDGLLVSGGKKWARNRRLLTPGFHFDVLKPYVEIYNECVAVMMDKFQRESCKTGRSVDICKPVGLCALDIILRCAFSFKQNVQSDHDNAYVKAVGVLSTQAVRRTLNPLLFSEFMFRLTSGGRQFFRKCEYSHKVATEVIEKRRKELNRSDTTHDVSLRGRYVDFLDILLLAQDAEGQGLTQEEILHEVETFMFAGHDTTTSGISWILYNLARHPEIQSRARKEVDAILEGRNSDKLEWNNLGQMPYLLRCIKESLRLHPPVPFIGRELQNPLRLDGKEIPVGTYVDISIWNLHHNPTVWSDPMTYDPERFLPEKMAEMDSHAFLPFSAGPRNCIGQNFAMNKMKTTIARILHRFELSVDESKPVKMKFDAVLRAENGIYLHFKER